MQLSKGIDRGAADLRTLSLLLAGNERAAPGRDDPACGGIHPIGSATPALTRSGERPLPNLVRITLAPERRQV